MKISRKENTMKLTPVLILMLVLMLDPTILRADTSITAQDVAVGRPLMFIPQQALPDMNSALQNRTETAIPETLVAETTVSPSVHASEAGTMISLAEKDSSEEKETEAKGQVTVENVPENNEAEEQQIADPLAPVNKVMFHFNDKLYFWGIKPVTQVYSHIVPEEFRFVISNFYDNLWAPCRMLNNLFQLRFKAAGNELIRFLFNSFAGIGGMGDMADKALGIKKQDADFGQTLGHYGLGHGIYLVLPLFGPSSIRDGIGLVGDQLMHPLTYAKGSDLRFEEKVAISAHERVNKTSFTIGDYESFKEAAIDPYVSMRDAFVQNRLKKVEESKQ